MRRGRDREGQTERDRENPKLRTVSSEAYIGLDLLNH